MDDVHLPKIETKLRKQCADLEAKKKRLEQEMLKLQSAYTILRTKTKEEVLKERRNALDSELGQLKEKVEKYKTRYNALLHEHKMNGSSTITTANGTSNDIVKAEPSPPTVVSRDPQTTPLPDESFAEHLDYAKQSENEGDQVPNDNNQPNGDTENKNTRKLISWINILKK